METTDQPLKGGRSPVRAFAVVNDFIGQFRYRPGIAARQKRNDRHAQGFPCRPEFPQRWFSLLMCHQREAGVHGTIVMGVILLCRRTQIPPSSFASGNSSVTAWATSCHWASCPASTPLAFTFGAQALMSLHTLT